MGDMGEIFRDMREHNKQVREKRKNKYEPLLEQIGAELKSDSVYQFKDWFLYPTKGFAMNKYNSKKRMSINDFIKKVSK